MPINKDILFHTLEVMEPNPVVFCRLALVSRDFYLVFTSDRAWRPIDVYDYDTNIFQSFWDNTNAGSRGRMMSYWQSHTTIRFNSKLSGPPHESDLFALLGFIVHALPRQFTKDSPRVTNERVVRLAIRINSDAAKWASKELLRKKKFALEVVRDNGCILEYLSEELKSNREVVLRAVANDCPNNCTIHSQWWPVLSIAASQFRNDIEIAWAAIRANPQNVSLLGEDLRTDRELIFYALSQAGCLLKDVDDEYKDDRLAAMVAIETKLCLRCSPSKRKCLPIQFVSARLRSDPDFMKLAAQANSDCIPYTAPELLNDLSFLKFILDLEPEHLALLMDSLASDTGLLNQALEKQPNLFQFSPEFVRADKQRAMTAVGYEGLLLACAIGVEDDFDVVFRAVCNDGMALQYASRKLRKDPIIVSAAIRQTPTSFMYALNPVLVARNVSAILVTNIELEELKIFYQQGQSSQAYREIVGAVLTDKGYFIRFIKEMLHDKACLEAAVWSFADAPLWANYKLLREKGVMEQINESQKYVSSEYTRYSETNF